MFKGVTFNHKEIPGLAVNKYRVYSGHDQYVMVEAANAQAALETSGVANPLRVLRDTIYLENVLPLDKIGVKNVEAEVVEPAPAAASEASPAVEPMAEEPDQVVEPAQAAETDKSTLSNDDVEKLLNT